MRRVFRQLMSGLLWVVLPLSGAGEGGADGLRFQLPVTNLETIASGVVPPVYSMASDPRGLLYFGSTVVSRYDGSRWTNIAVEGTNQIWALECDAAGTLWIGAVGNLGYLESNGTGLPRFVSLLPQLPEAEREHLSIWSVREHGGSVYFFGDDRIYCWDGKAMSIWPFRSYLRLFSYAADERVFFTNQLDGLYEIREGKPELLFDFEQFGGGVIAFVVSDPDGDGVLIGTSEDLYLYEDHKLEQVAAGALRGVVNDLVVGATALEHGMIAIGTFLNGVYLMDRAGVIRSHVNERSGLRDQRIHFVERDSRGTVWAGLRSGLAHFPSNLGIRFSAGGGEFETRNPRELTRSEGRLYALTNRDLLVLEGEPLAGISPSENPTYYLSDICSHPDGLIVSGFLGLQQLSAEGFSRMQYVPDYVSAVEAVPDHPDHLIYLKDFEVNLVSRRNGRWEQNRNLAILPEQGQRIYFTSPRVFWVTTADGSLFRIKVGSFGETGGSPTVGAAKIDLPGKGTTSRETMLSRMGDRLIAAAGSRLFAYDDTGETFVQLRTFDRWTVTALSNPSSDGSLLIFLYAVGESGGRHSAAVLFRFGEDGQPEFSTLSIYGLDSAGIVNDAMIEGSSTGGRLWVAAQEGILQIDLQAVRTLESPPDVQLQNRSERSGIALADPQAMLTVPFGQTAVTFDYAALPVDPARPVLFQTRLIGLEKEWSTPAFQPTRQLSGMRESLYQFAVRSVLPSGQVGASSYFTFRVAPPWYRTSWAYAFYATVAVGALSGLFWWRAFINRRRTSQLEEIIRIRTLQLQDANTAKSDFVANISHELRNPMNGVIGMTELLMRTRMEPHEAQLLKTLKNCAHHLSQMIGDILDFSKIEANQVTLDVQALELHKLTREIVDITSWQAHQAGREIILDMVESSPLWLEGDTSKIRQILINFLNNAVKYSDKGLITLKVSWEQVLSNHVRVAFAVSDEGPGIPDAEKANVFRKFYRMERSRSSGVRGLGLGLSVCATFAERMGGEVGVSDNESGGSTFHFTVSLPVARESEIADATTDKPDLIGNGRALVVDDLDYNRLVAREFLESLGYEVDDAPDGRGALEKMGTQTYAMVLLDWDLPDMNGVEVTRIHRAREPVDRHMLIFATTAYTTRDKVIECLNSGMDGFISKPVTVEKILNAVNRHRDREFGSRDLLLESNPGLDLSSLQMLSKNDPERLCQNLRDYLKAFDLELFELENAAALRDLRKVRKHAHRMLSHLAIISARNIIGVVREVQDHAQAGQEEEVGVRIPALRAEAAELRREIQALIKSHSPAQNPS